MAAVSTLSKSRYKQISDMLADIYGNDEKLQQALTTICQIMKFDPEASRYTPELAQKEKERRHRLRDEHGISTYVSSGLKKHREKTKTVTKKERLNTTYKKHLPAQTSCAMNAIILNAITRINNKLVFDPEKLTQYPPLYIKTLQKYLPKEEIDALVEFLQRRGFGGHDVDLTDLLCEVSLLNQVTFAQIIDSESMTDEITLKYLKGIQKVCKLPVLQRCMDPEDIEVATKTIEEWINMADVGAFDWTEYEEGSFASKTSNYEERFRERLEELTGKAFKKYRPSWLINRATGHQMELDMYNDDVKLAIEYNGKQHYEYPNNFHHTELQFLKQIKRDLLKQKLCKQHGIKLIYVRSCEKLEDEVGQVVPHCFSSSTSK